MYYEVIFDEKEGFNDREYIGTLISIDEEREQSQILRCGTSVTKIPDADIDELRDIARGVILDTIHDKLLDMVKRVMQIR